MEGMQRIDEVWRDISSGKLPLLFDSEHRDCPGILPVSLSNCYEGDETGDYDYSIIGVRSGFFESLEYAVRAGSYKKYESATKDPRTCAKLTWDRVWNEQKEGLICRAFTRDYEIVIDAQYTKRWQSPLSPVHRDCMNTS